MMCRENNSYIHPLSLSLYHFFYVSLPGHFCLFVYLFVCFLFIWDKRIRWNSRFAGFYFLAVMFGSHLCVFIDCLRFRTLRYNVSDFTKGFFFYYISFLLFSLLFSAFTANPCQSVQIIISFLGNCLPTPPLSQH